MKRLQNCKPEQMSLDAEDQKTWDLFVDQVFNKQTIMVSPDKSLDDSLFGKLDLHGMTVQQAFKKTEEFLYEHWISGSKSTVVITGKSGKIADEFPFWIDNLDFVKSHMPLKDKSGQHGAFRIFFQKHQ